MKSPASISVGGLLFLCGLLQGAGAAPPGQDSAAAAVSVHEVGVGILDFRKRTLTPAVEDFRRTLTETLIVDLQKVEGVYVVEREVLEPFLSELALGESEMVAPASRASFGKALPADLIIEGSILEAGGRRAVEIIGFDVLSGSQVFKVGLDAEAVSVAEVSAAAVDAIRRWLSAQGTTTPAQGQPVPGGTLAVCDILYPSDPLAGSALRSMLVTAAFRLKGAALVERENLDAVLEELRLQNSGAVDPATRLELGRLLGARWIAYGDARDEGDRELALSLKVAESETGRVLFARRYRTSRQQARGRLASFISELGRSVSMGIQRGDGDRRAEAELFLIRGTTGSVATLWRGNEFSMRGRIDDLRRAIFLNPNSVDAHMELQEVFSRMFRHDEARAVVKSLVTRVPEDRWKPGERAAAYYRWGVLDGWLLDFEAAVLHYRAALAAGGLGGREEDAKLAIGQMLTLSGNEEAALAAYRPLLDSPRDEARRFSAYLLERAGRFDEAIHLYKRVAAQERGDQPSGFGWVNAQDRLTLIARVRAADAGPYRSFLEAERLTHFHQQASFLQVNRFYKDNFDIFGFPTSPERAAVARKAHLTDHLMRAIGILSELVTVHPAHPVLPDALWLLADCYEHLTRTGRSADSADVSSAALRAYMQLADSYARHRRALRALELAVRFEPDAVKKRVLLLRRVSWPGAPRESRLPALLALGDLERTEFRDAASALSRYNAVLEDRTWMELQGGHWLNVIEGALWGIRAATGRSQMPSGEERVEECLKRALYLCAGSAFEHSPDRRLEEAAWAYQRGYEHATPAEMRADSLWRLADTLERLGYSAEAAVRYQRVIDEFLDFRADLARDAQARLDALAARMPLESGPKREFGDLAQKFARWDAQYARFTSGK